MTPLDLRIEVFKALGWTDLAVRLPAPHHWPLYPLDEDGNALTGRRPHGQFGEPGPLDLNVMGKLFEQWKILALILSLALLTGCHLWPPYGPNSWDNQKAPAICPSPKESSP